MNRELAQRLGGLRRYLRHHYSNIPITHDGDMVVAATALIEQQRRDIERVERLLRSERAYTIELEKKLGIVPSASRLDV